MLPDVGSTKTVFPGEISPRFSASVIMLRAIRSLTEFAGLNDSILQTISASHPSDNLVSLTNGVEPISSKMLSAMFSFNFVELNLLLVVILVDGVNACVTTRDAIEISAIENFIVVFVDVVIDICMFIVAYLC